MRKFKELKEMKKNLNEKSKKLYGKSGNLNCKATAFRLVLLEKYSKIGLEDGKNPVEWTWFSCLKPFGKSHEWYLEQFRKHMQLKDRKIKFTGFLSHMNDYYKKYVK